jgi:hypothetical protein
MKTKNKLNLLAITAAVLSLSAATGVGQVFSPEDAINNRAVADQPTSEGGIPVVDAHCGSAHAMPVVTKAKQE